MAGRPYPRPPIARPNIFRVLRPPQHLLAKARACGVDTSTMVEFNAWQRAGRPATWTNGMQQSEW